MKILCISNTWPPDVLGGAERVAASLVGGLQSRGHTVRVLTRRAEPGPDQTVDGVTRVWPGGKLFPEPDAPQARQILTQVNTHWLDRGNPRIESALLRILREDPPEVIHSHNLYGFGTRIWRRIAEYNIPVIHTAHDSYLLCAKGTLFYPKGEGFLLKTLNIRHRKRQREHVGHPAVLTFPSVWMRDTHIQFGIEHPDLRVVPNGIRLPPAPKRSSAPKCRLLYLGQLDTHKGVQHLVPLLNKLGPGFELHIAGKGRLAEQLRDAAAPRTDVTLHGFLEEDAKQALLNASDILLLPGRYPESFGLVVVEAFASGVPVVVFQHGGAAELVEEGRTGARVSPFDLDTFAEAIHRVHNNLNTLRPACLQRAQDFELSHMIDRMEEIYLEVLAG